MTGRSLFPKFNPGFLQFSYFSDCNMSTPTCVLRDPEFHGSSTLVTHQSRGGHKKKPGGQPGMCNKSNQAGVVPPAGTPPPFFRLFQSPLCRLSHRLNTNYYAIILY